MTVRAAWLTNRGDPAGGQTRNDTRLTPTGTMTPVAEMTSLPGAIPAGNPFALEAVGPMSATIGVGRALIQGTDIQGAYPVAVTAPETLIFTDGDPSNPRVDLVVLRVYDGEHDTSGQAQATVEIIPGTAGPAPEPPPVPPAALPLYQVTIPTGAGAGTGGIDFPAATTDVRTYTVALGGITPSTDAPGAYRAQYRDNGTGLQRWSGTSWVGMANELVPWTRVAVASGYSHNGNNQGDVLYRVIDLLGTRFVQWRGGMNVTYTSAGPPAHEGLFLTTALPAIARPSSLRTVPVACSGTASTIVTVKIDFHTQGTARLITDAGDQPPWVSFHGVMYATI